MWPRTITSVPRAARLDVLEEEACDVLGMDFCWSGHTAQHAA
jgi:hypothetical protein